MVKVKWIALLLIVLIAASLLLRLEGVRRDHRHTFDETLYPYLAYRLNGGLSNYNAVQIYAESLKDALPLPSYLSAPLFKHPPLFPYLIRTYFYTFGHTMQSAELVSVHAGCALILIAYLLGATLYNRKIGLIAALLVAIDPIAWICSEKIWLAMTLA